MSHITEGRLKVADLDALEEAARECGLELRRGQTTHAWYGSFQYDSAEGRRVARDRGVEQLGKCDHALRLMGHQSGDYEIGLVQQADGSFKTYYDTWGTHGRRLVEAMGPGERRLRQEYAAAVTRRRTATVLARKGYRLAGRERLADGTLRLRLRRR